MDIWNKLNGWSEEFSPTGGDDTDFAMKLWKNDVRIFKVIDSFYFTFFAVLM